MISGIYGQFRVADADDAETLCACYRSSEPRAALLDGKREPLLPTLDELRETLARMEGGAAQFYAAEDLEGEARLFFALRRARHEARFGEFALFYTDAALLQLPLAEELVTFIRKRAFEEMNLNKMTAQALDTEETLRAFFLRQGWRSQGRMRDAVYARGRWHALDAFALFAAPPTES